jgi:hypothetical protein
MLSAMPPPVLQGGGFIVQEDAMGRIQLEKDAEHEILIALHKVGLMAFHVDATIDGFPDIMVIGGRISLVEVKYDRTRGRVKLSELMEASQPVFMENARDSGFNSMFLCVFDGEAYSVYDTGRILYASMAGYPLGTLPLVVTNDGPGSVADFLAKECRC